MRRAVAALFSPMHQLRTPARLRAFRLASLLFCIKFLLLATGIGFMVHSVIFIDWHSTQMGFGLVAASLLATLTRVLMAGYIRCPLCMAAVFAPLASNKHRRARRLFGSHRLRVAVSILFRNWFTCPYCNEATAIKLRQRRQHGSRPR